jgi:hypothetical protein
LRESREAANNFKRGGKMRPSWRNGFNFTRRRAIQRWFRGRANEQK